MKRILIVSALSAGVFISGFGLGAFYIIRYFEKATITAHLYQSDLSLVTLKRINEQRTADAIVTLKQSIEAVETILREHSKGGIMNDEINKMLKRIESYHNSNSNTLKLSPSHTTTDP